MAKVSIVIMGHNASNHLEGCLSSIFCQDFQDFEVIWVDSASTDGSLKKIQTQFPQVKIVALTYNAGYRCATNLGAHEAKGEYLVICNQDTSMDRYWLTQMINCIETDHTIGIVAPKILMFDDAQVINEAGNVLHYAGLYGSRGLGASAAEFSVSEPIATMSGCCFLIRRSVWLALGGFSADFDKLDTAWHASFEDVDLAWRTQLAGFKVVFCAHALMYHKYLSKGMIPSRFCGYEWGRYLVIIRNYEFRTLFLLFPLLLALEVGTWLYAIGKGWPWLIAKAKAMHWLIANRALLSRMRQRVQKMRRIRDAVIVTRMDSTIRITHVIPSLRLTRLVQRIVDATFKVYHRFFLFGLNLLESFRNNID